MMPKLPIFVFVVAPTKASNSWTWGVDGSKGVIKLPIDQIIRRDEPKPN